jgi:hypothetical protein
MPLIPHAWNRFRGIASEFAIRLRPGRRVPVLQQLSSVECGAACLALVRSYYGRNTKVSEVRDLCSVGRDGLNGLALVNAARKCGLRTKAYTLEPDQLKYLRLPAIAHWGFNHFVVVERSRSDLVEIIDPAQGRRSLTRKEFGEYFTGVVLTLEPGTRLVRETPPGKVSSLWEYFNTDSRAGESTERPTVRLCPIIRIRFILFVRWVLRLRSRSRAGINPSSQRLFIMSSGADKRARGNNAVGVASGFRCQGQGAGLRSTQPAPTPTAALVWLSKPKSQHVHSAQRHQLICVRVKRAGARLPLRR